MVVSVPKASPEVVSVPRVKKTAKNYRDQIVSADEAADFLNISRRGFYRLVENGTIPRVGEGEYALGDVAESYWKSLLNSESLGAARARLTNAQADLAELELAEEKGEMHRASAVMHVWSETVLNAKTKLLAIPSKVSPMLVGQDVNVIKSILKKQVDEVLHEIAEYNDERIRGASAILSK